MHTHTHTHTYIQHTHTLYLSAKLKRWRNTDTVENRAGKGGGREGGGGLRRTERNREEGSNVPRPLRKHNGGEQICFAKDAHIKLSGYCVRDRVVMSASGHRRLPQTSPAPPCCRGRFSDTPAEKKKQKRTVTPHRWDDPVHPVSSVVQRVSDFRTNNEMEREGGKIAKDERPGDLVALPPPHSHPHPPLHRPIFPAGERSIAASENRVTFSAFPNWLMPKMCNISQRSCWRRRPYNL